MAGGMMKDIHLQTYVNYDLPQRLKDRKVTKLFELLRAFVSFETRKNEIDN